MGLQIRDLEIRLGRFHFGPFSYEFSETGLYLIRGKNGAGKSSLLRALLGRIPLKPGALSEFGFPVGTVGLESVLFQSWTVEENLNWFSEILGRSICELAELQPLLSQKFSHLSQGLKRQVELSLILTLNFSTYFLDEPMSPLDRSQREIYSRKIVEKSKTSLILLTTHFEEELFGNPKDIVQL